MVPQKESEDSQWSEELMVQCFKREKTELRLGLIISTSKELLA